MSGNIAFNILTLAKKEDYVYFVDETWSDGKNYRNKKAIVGNRNIGIINNMDILYLIDYYNDFNANDMSRTYSFPLDLINLEDHELSEVFRIDSKIKGKDLLTGNYRFENPNLIELFLDGNYKNIVDFIVNHHSFDINYHIIRNTISKPLELISLNRLQDAIERRNIDYINSLLKNERIKQLLSLRYQKKRHPLEMLLTSMIEQFYDSILRSTNEISRNPLYSKISSLQLLLNGYKEKYNRGEISIVDVIVCTVNYVFYTVSSNELEQDLIINIVIQYFKVIDKLLEMNIVIDYSMVETLLMINKIEGKHEGLTAVVNSIKSKIISYKEIDASVNFSSYCA